MPGERRPIHEHDYGAAVIPCSQEHGADSTDSAEVRALNREDLWTLVDAVLGGNRYKPHREAAERVRRVLAAAPRSGEGLDAAIAHWRDIVKVQPNAKARLIDVLAALDAARLRENDDAR